MTIVAAGRIATRTGARTAPTGPWGRPSRPGSARHGTCLVVIGMFVRPVTHDRFVEEVERLAVLPAGDGARAAEAVLEVLGQRLGQREAEIVADPLPAPLADALTRRAFDTHFDLAELAARVARELGVDDERARAIVQAVCEVTGQATSDEGLQHLETLPEELARLFRRRPHHAPTPAPRPAAGPPGRLAGGSPGSSRGLADASPEDLAHRDSVARSDEPHADDKISSGHSDRELSVGHPTPGGDSGR